MKYLQDCHIFRPEESVNSSFFQTSFFHRGTYVGIILSQEIDTVSSDGRTLLRLRIAAKEDIRQALKVLPFYCAHSQSKILPTKMKWTNCKFISFR